MNNIRNMEKFIDAIVDWAPLNDAFRGAVRISDIDGIVERRGHFAIFEQKSEGAPIPMGQNILLDQLVSGVPCGDCRHITPSFWTVFILFGDLEDPSKLEIRRTVGTVRLDVSYSRVFEIVRFWDCCARQGDFDKFDERIKELGDE